MSTKKFNCFAILVLGLYLPTSGYAWNIICGVSTGAFKAGAMETKWEADSNALTAISHFYAGISALQSVNVEYTKLTAPAEKREIEIRKLSKASAFFKESNKSFRKAKEGAAILIKATMPLDDLGKNSIELWKKLETLNDGFINSIDSGTLPSLFKLHDAINITTEILNLGMQASLIHLGQYKLYHTEGMTKFR